MTADFDLRDAEVHALGTRGWFLRDDLLGRPASLGVAAAVEALAVSGRLRPSGVGRPAVHRVDEEVRSDLMAWVTPDDAPAALAGLWASFLALRDALNREAYLGLDSMDVQAARYPGGAAGYRRHRDAFAAGPGVRPSRRVTAIYYANPGWRPADGGVLRLHPGAGADGHSEPVDVEPILDRLLVFLSERVEHEVLPTRVPRRAVTAWFRPRDPLGS
ncbi:MAG TPA: 2OG-Fe(II) oxygenase [Methylomirabilota bacterium]